jgi:YmgG-like glycine-zipper protein/YXWGXW repeat-containing protein
MAEPRPRVGLATKQKADSYVLVSILPMETRNKAVALALCAVLSGCVGTGPNTQQGAVAGGAAGALAGAVIGNNSGGRNGPAGALIGAIVGAIAGGTIGNSVDQERGTLYGQPLAAVPVYPTYAGAPEVTVAQPGPNSVWVPGYWEWTGNGYTWTPGYWTMPPPGFAVFVRGGWVFRGGGYYWRRPYWR